MMLLDLQLHSRNWKILMVNGRSQDFESLSGELVRTFRLTVPTGGEKLLHRLPLHCATVFGDLCDTLEFAESEVFRKILGDENVLENHCNGFLPD